MLKISKKADYALMALQHIATVQFGDVTPGRVVNTKEIAEEYNIPLELLAKVLQTLARNALAHELVRMLRDHIAREERDLFPAAHQLLVPGQWDTVDRLTDPSPSRT